MEITEIDPPSLRQRSALLKPIRFRQDDIENDGSLQQSAAISVNIERPTEPPPSDPRLLKATRKMPHASFSRE